MQKQIWPFLFFIGAKLASQVGCWLGLMKPTSNILHVLLNLHIDLLPSSLLNSLIPFVMFTDAY